MSRLYGSAILNFCRTPSTSLLSVSEDSQRNKGKINQISNISKHPRKHEQHASAHITKAKWMYCRLKNTKCHLQCCLYHNVWCKCRTLWLFLQALRDQETALQYLHYICQKACFVACWYLVEGITAVRWEWDGVCPPRCLLKPLVNCSAGMNVPLLTAWSGTRAADHIHICTLVLWCS